MARTEHMSIVYCISCAKKFYMGGENYRFPMNFYETSHAITVQYVHDLAHNSQLQIL